MAGTARVEEARTDAPGACKESSARPAAQLQTPSLQGLDTAGSWGLGPSAAGLFGGALRS